MFFLNHQNIVNDETILGKIKTKILKLLEKNLKKKKKKNPRLAKFKNKTNSL
jgi:hypothetical protein